MEEKQEKECSTVVVHVSGGNAEVASQSENVEVFILDFDNYRDGNTEIEMGSEYWSQSKGYPCPSCHRYGSEFEWNAATDHMLQFHVKPREGFVFEPIQHCDDHDNPYVCAFCFDTNKYRDIIRMTKTQKLNVNMDIEIPIAMSKDEFNVRLKQFLSANTIDYEGNIDVE